MFEPAIFRTWPGVRRSITSAMSSRCPEPVLRRFAVGADQLLGQHQVGQVEFLDLVVDVGQLNPS
jgi:hypothetical protein